MLRSPGEALLTTGQDTGKNEENLMRIMECYTIMVSKVTAFFMAVDGLLYFFV